MSSLARYRQNSICCFSLKVGCKLLATLEMFLPPIYIYAREQEILDIPYFMIVLFAVYYVAVLMLFWGTITRCCLKACILIISLPLRVLLILAIIGWSLYMAVEGIDIAIHLGTLLFELVFGIYTLLCTWSYYLELTETPIEPRDKLKHFRQLYCCCGCSLRIGCILIAVIELCYPILLTCSPIEESTVVVAINWFLYLSSSIILLFGSIKEHTTVLLGWVIYRTVVMFFTFGGFIYLINEAFYTYDEKTRLIVLFLVTIVFYFAVNGYFWTIVYSYYMEIKEKRRREDKTVAPLRV